MAKTVAVEGTKMLIFFQLTLTMATGFVVAWTPFAALSIFETFYPPTEIPSGQREKVFCSCPSRQLH